MRAGQRGDFTSEPDPPYNQLLYPMPAATPSPGPPPRPADELTAKVAPVMDRIDRFWAQRKSAWGGSSSVADGAPAE